MDKRTQKTKNCILQALFKLLEKKSLDDITITELAETANINRKTFYAHYNSVQDVIEETGNEIADNLLTLCKEMSNDYSIWKSLTMKPMCHLWQHLLLVVL